MNVRRTIIVWVVAIVGLAAVWLTRPSGTQIAEHQAAGSLQAVSQLSAEALERLEVTRPDGEQLVFVRDRDRWSQEQPIQHPVDPYSMYQMVSVARSLMVSQIVPENQRGEWSMAALKLDPPLASIRYSWSDDSLTLHLGRRGIAGRSYLQVVGDPAVYVVGSQLHERLLDMNPKEWRDRRLFSDVSIESEQIQIQDGSGNLVLVCEQKQWKMIEPVTTRADPTGLEEIVDALGRAQSSGFIADNPRDLEPFGLAHPEGAITVSSSRLREEGDKVVRDPVVERLLIGGRIGGSQDRFALVEGRSTVLRLRSETLLSIFRRPWQLADPTGSGTQSADVKWVRIQFGDEVLVLERDLERWVAPDYARREVPRQLVEELLGQITETRAPKVEFVETYPRELEVGTVILSDYGRRPIDTVRIARDPDSGEWALENGDRVLRIFPASMQLRLLPTDYGLSRLAGAANP